MPNRIRGTVTLPGGDTFRTWLTPLGASGSGQDLTEAEALIDTGVVTFVASSHDILYGSRIDLADGGWSYVVESVAPHFTNRRARIISCRTRRE